MVYRPKVSPTLAFVLMPFKAPFDSYYEEIIKPAVRAVGLEARKADEIYSTGPIIHDIWTQIWESTIVIADVTGKNANVNYELGICHTLGVPTVIITQNLDDVPFDYRHRRCISYATDDVHWQRKLKKSITETVKRVLAGENVSPELPWPYEASPLHRSQIGQFVLAADAQDSVINGSRLVRDAVASAFGPQGTSVFIQTKDGEGRYFRSAVEIASSISSAEPLYEVGVNHGRQLAKEMRDSAGDGSKTALLLFQKMIEVGGNAIKKNHPRSDLFRGMERATEAIVSAVRGASCAVSFKILSEVAQTAACGDRDIAGIMVEAFKRAGRDGIVTIERNSSSDLTLDVMEGMHFDRGYLDPSLLLPDEAHECSLQDSYILLSELKISSMKDLLPILEQVASSKRPLLIIADDVEGEALATLVVNRKKGTLNCVAVKAPGYSDRRRAMLQDIAVVTEANVISPSLGRNLANVNIGDLGRAGKVTVTRDSTTIVGGAGESSTGRHVEALREEISRATDPFTVEKLRERLVRLSGAIVTLRIGGTTAQDRSRRIYAATAAMHSVQKAIEEGVVIGGGVSLIRAQATLEKLSFSKPGEIAGIQSISLALEEPLRQLALNGRMNPDEVVKKTKRAKSKTMGLNAQSAKLQDLAEYGVRDAVATVTTAMQLASSHARTLLATGLWDASGNQEAPTGENVTTMDLQDGQDL